MADLISLGNALPLARRDLFRLAAALPLLPAQQIVTLHTALGDIVCRLEMARAPLSSGAFLACIHAGAYNGGGITRVVRPGNDHGTPSISVIQGATRPGTGPFPTVPHETTAQTGLRHLDGTLSLPRDAPGSATGAEFFICIGAQPALDFGGLRNKDGKGFAAFGQVVHGMEIVRRIGAMPATGKSPDAYTAGQILAVPVPIRSAA